MHERLYSRFVAEKVLLIECHVDWLPCRLLVLFYCRSDGVLDDMDVLLSTANRHILLQKTEESLSHQLLEDRLVALLVSRSLR